MTYVLRALIPALWILWLAYWIVAARSTYETRRRESFASPLSQYGLLIAGGILLGVPNILGPSLEAPFHGHPGWLLLAVSLVALRALPRRSARAHSVRALSALANDKNAVRLLVEIVEEIIAAGFERAQADNPLAVSGHDFFNTQAHAFELHRRRVRDS